MTPRSAYAPDSRCAAGGSSSGKPHAASLVFGGVSNQGHLADAFRGHLALAGVTREELNERTSARQPIRLHDTRAGFVSTALRPGGGLDLGAHGASSSSQINAYRRLAQTLSEIGTSWFVNMAPRSLSSRRWVFMTQPTRPSRRTAAARASVSPRKWTGGDLNPYVLPRRNLNPLRLPIPPPVRGDESAI